METVDNYKVDDLVMYETLHNAYGVVKVVRVTKTQAVLDNGERLPIAGVNGCKHLKNWRNKHMVHYQTYYRLPNYKVECRATSKNFNYK